MSNSSISITDGQRIEEILRHVSDPGTAAAVRAANIILIPEAGYTEVGRPAFRPNTKDAFDFLRQNLPPELSPEIAASDDDFVELALHSNEVWIPTLLILADNPHTISVTLNVISNYIYDLLRGAIRPNNANVRSKVVVQGENKSTAFDYDGPPDTFERLMIEAIKKTLEQ